MTSPVQKTQIVCAIDEPARWDALLPRVFVRGWCYPRVGRIVGLRVRRGLRCTIGIHGLERPDVAAAHPADPGALRSGFVAVIDQPQGGETVGLEVLLDEAGGETGAWHSIAIRQFGSASGQAVEHG